MQDISVTYPANSTIAGWDPIFPDCVDACLADYHYFIIESDTADRNFYIYLQYRSDATTSGNTSQVWTFSQGVNFDKMIFSYSCDTITSLCGFWNRSAPTTFTHDVTFTLTNSLGGSAPSGNLDISQNGTYDVSSYATATVDVPVETVEGDYHNDLVNLNQAIYVVPATLLVIYFFYCIYRMIIKTVGGV